MPTRGRPLTRYWTNCENFRHDGGRCSVAQSASSNRCGTFPNFIAASWTAVSASGHATGFCGFRPKSEENRPTVPDSLHQPAAACRIGTRRAGFWKLVSIFLHTDLYNNIIIYIITKTAEWRPSMNRHDGPLGRDL